MTALTPERRVGEAELLRALNDWESCASWGYAGVMIRDLARDLLDERAAVARLTAEVERLREFAERMISPCEWGPSAFVENQEDDISDWAVSCGILVERVHAQPCEIEGCECDGSPTLLYFAWSHEAAALSLPTPAPEAPNRFVSGEQVMEHYVEGYQRPPAPEGPDGK